MFFDVLVVVVGKGSLRELDGATRQEVQAQWTRHRGYQASRRYLVGRVPSRSAQDADGLTMSGSPAYLLLVDVAMLAVRVG